MTPERTCLTLIVIFTTVAVSEAFLYNAKPTEIPHPTVRCPLSDCKWRPNATFSCPKSGCMLIPKDLGTDVEEIYLQENQISIIPILDYPKLKRLDLADNNISKIEDNAFQNCDNVETLLLNQNKLTTITTAQFNGLIKVKYLYLQQNKFTKLPHELFGTSPLLERLDFSVNFISELGTSITDMDNLKFLHLQENQISELKPSNFWGLDKLEWLELMQNKLQTLEASTFEDLKNLLHLDLNFNNISTIEVDAFIGLDNLKRLSIEHNQLTSLEPGMFDGLSSIQELYIGYNYFYILQYGVFPETLMKISLMFSHRLTTIHNSSLSDLPKLNELYMGSCHNLQWIENGSLAGDTKLEVLDLSNNHLQTLPEDLVIWDQMQYLDLSGNPWDCDCHLEWMLEVDMKLETRQMIRCDTPLSVRGKYLHKLQPDEFKCGEVYRISFRQSVAVGLVMFLTVIFIMGIIAFIYLCRHKVCPCCYTQAVGKYRAMYNSVNEDDDTTIQFEKKPPSNGVQSGTVV